MKDYQRIFLTILLLFFFSAINGQFLERQLLSGFGNLSKTKDFQVSATGGELSIQTQKTETMIFTVGFQQPDQEELVRVFDDQFHAIGVKISPNPLFHRFTLNFETNRSFFANYILVDAMGSLVRRSDPFLLSSSHNLEVDCSQLDGGTYYLTIEDETNKPVKVMKIIKL